MKCGPKGLAKSTVVGSDMVIRFLFRMRVNSVASNMIGMSRVGKAYLKRDKNAC